MTRPFSSRAHKRSPRIFISYRRGEAGGYAGRLYDALQNRFGREVVFMDRGMSGGVDFVEGIESALEACDVLVAVIHPAWLKPLDTTTERRLDDPADWVRRELTGALERSKTIAPCVVGGASLPSAEALPDPLKPIARLQAYELSDVRWDVDVAELGDGLEAALKAAAIARRQAEVAAHPGSVYRLPDRSWAWTGTLQADPRTALEVAARVIQQVSNRGTLLTGDRTVVFIERNNAVETTIELQASDTSETVATVTTSLYSARWQVARYLLGKRRVLRMVRALTSATDRTI